LTNLGDGKDGPSVPSPYQFLLSADKPEVIDLIINNLSGGKLVKMNIFTNMELFSR
jgi:hypothetical protein